MIRSSIINALTAFLLLLLMAACVGVFLGILYADPGHPLIQWFALADWQSVAAIFGVLALVTIAFRFVVMHYVSKPLYNIRSDIFALAHADKQHQFHNHGRDDEFGDIARTLHECQAVMLRIEEMEAVESAKLRISAHRKEQLETHIRAFESRVGQVVHVVSESAQTLHTVAEALVNAVLLSQRQASQMRDSIQQSSGQIAAIAKDSDTIHHSISDMVMAIQRATETSNGALSQTQNASESTVQLTAATQKISGVIQLIRKITEKINLLALNAGIESVRAGEAGKGFAVVAQEVKTLATQTKRATEDIVDNIMALQECTSTTEAMLGSASRGIDKVAIENEGLLGKIKAQHKLTNNIAYNMQHATTIIKDVSGNIDHIHSHISDVDSASKNVTTSARELNAQASILSQEVERFLRDIDMSSVKKAAPPLEDAA